MSSFRARRKRPPHCRQSATCINRQAQLRTDAICAGDEYRFSITIDGDFEQRAEAAESGQHFRSHRTFDRRLDPLDELIARFDIDAGIFVGDRLGGRHTASCG